MVANAWWLINKDVKGEKELYEEALTKIGKLETFLIKNGITEKQLTLAQERAESFVNIPRQDMTQAQADLYSQLVFNGKWNKAWGEKYKHGSFDYRDYPPS